MGRQREARDADDVCFLIAPIGEAATPTRDHSDLVRDYVVGPVATAVGLRVVRAEGIERPGYITHHVIDLLRTAPLVIADLTERNPNVYYELGVRHAASLPTVLIAKRGEPLPADLVHQRVVFYETSDPRALEDAVTELRGIASAALDGDYLSPVEVAEATSTLSLRSPSDAALSEILLVISELRSQLDMTAERSTERRRHLLTELENQTRGALSVLAQGDVPAAVRPAFGQLVDSARKVVDEFGASDARLRLSRAMREARKLHGKGEVW